MSIFNKINRLCWLSLPLLAASSTVLAAQVVDLNLSSNNVLNGFTVTKSLTNKTLQNQSNVLLQVSEQFDQKGNKHTRYQQYYNAVPVYGEQIIVHQKKANGKNLMASAQIKLTGTLVKNLAEDVGHIDTSKYSPSAMLDELKQSYRAQHVTKNESLQFRNEKSELVYVLDENGQAKLAYHVNFFVDSEKTGHPARPFYLVDAETKTVLKTWDGLTTDKLGTGPGGNKKIGKYLYGTDYDGLDIEEKDGNCLLQTENVKTIHLNNSTWGDDKPFSYDCYEQESDPANGSYSPLNDAHYFGGVVFNMYKEWYDTAPLLFQLALNVHYGYHYENAFWDGNSMSFGDGASYFYPLVALDVVAHEVSHGFTEQHSNLTYSGQSGGLNESFSDMAGKAAEFYMRGSNTWGIGQDITKEKEPLRYMDEPTKDGTSIDNVKDYHSGLDVHYSSGVYNKVFYLLSTSEGWDTRQAFDVMVAANSNYWTSSVNFAKAAWGVVLAAEDLGKNVEDVVNAFKEVGITCSKTACK